MLIDAMATPGGFTPASVLNTFYYKSFLGKRRITRTFHNALVLYFRSPYSITTKLKLRTA